MNSRPATSLVARTGPNCAPVSMVTISWLGAVPRPLEAALFMGEREQAHHEGEPHHGGGAQPGLEGKEQEAQRIEEPS